MLSRALLGLAALLSVSVDALAAEVVSSTTLPHVGEVPQERLYAGLLELGGPVRGRWRRRRSAEFLVWELADETIVRVQRTLKRVMVEDRHFDTAGWPLTTLTATDDGPQQIVVHTFPGTRIPLAGWEPQDIPGGTVLAPFPAEERPGGGVRMYLLQGEFDVWQIPTMVDLVAGEFLDGVVAGCGCQVEDRGPAWIDGQPGVRIRMRPAGPEPQDALDLWAIPRHDGLWLASFRVPQATDSVHDLAPGRALAALVTLAPPPEEGR